MKTERGREEMETSKVNTKIKEKRTMLGEVLFSLFLKQRNTKCRLTSTL
jgi:hypothetical protein